MLLSAAKLSTCTLHTNSFSSALIQKFSHLSWIIDFSCYVGSFLAQSKNILSFLPLNTKVGQERQKLPSDPLLSLVSKPIINLLPLSSKFTFIVCSEKTVSSPLYIFSCTSWHDIKLYQRKTLEWHCRREVILPVPSVLIQRASAEAWLSKTQLLQKRWAALLISGSHRWRTSLASPPAVYSS